MRKCRDKNNWEIARKFKEVETIYGEKTLEYVAKQTRYDITTVYKYIQIFETSLKLLDAISNDELEYLKSQLPFWMFYEIRNLNPEEAIEQGRTICIEFERLATTLCRYLGVPARSTPLKAHPVTQFWVQESEDDKGYWSNMETSRGRSEYKKGNLSAGFPSREDSKIAIIPHNSDAPIHMEWDFGAECWWLEDYGGSAKLTGTPEENMDEWEEKWMKNQEMRGVLG